MHPVGSGNCPETAGLIKIYSRRRRICLPAPDRRKVNVIPDFHRLNRSKTVEMSKEELNSKLREEVKRSQSRPAPKKPPADSIRQRKIAEKTRKQLPPQSPVRKQREAEAKRRERRELKEKRRKRRGSNIIYYIMLTMLAIVMFSVLSVTFLFNADGIIVTGESEYTDEQIIEASGLTGKENLVRLSTAGIPEKILDKLTALDSVSIDKVFPSKIRISVTRSVPMANFVYGGKTYLISHIGRVMAINSKDDSCMTIVGYKPAESVTVGGFIKAENADQDKLVKSISDAAEKADVDKITTVDITDNINISLTYDNRVVIYLGSVLQIDEKMRIIKELLCNGHIGETERVSLDVSDVTNTRQRPLTVTSKYTTPATSAPAETGAENGEETDTTSPAEE